MATKDGSGAGPTLHHLDTAEALSRFKDLLKRGGRLGIIGLGGRQWPQDLPYELASAVSTRFHKHVLGKQLYDHSSPIVWPPPDTHTEIYQIASSLLPGCNFKRHALWRYSLTWSKLERKGAVAASPGAAPTGSDTRTVRGG
ncbi:MAG: hypothetical protein ACC652_05495 [Acidimicrobiales bacterium]